MKVINVFIVFVVYTNLSIAQSVTLDNSFGSTGIVTTNIGGQAYGNSIAIQNDGKIIIGGGSDDDFVLVRYNSDGSMDSSFDNDGIVTVDFNNHRDIVQSIALQNDGKIITGGISNSDFAITRHNTDGLLDTTFGIGGKVITDIGATEELRKIAIQNDGKILATGYSYNASDYSRILLVRYNSDGSLDTTFDTDGIVTTFILNYTYAYSMCLQNDGKIIIVGACKANQFDNRNFSVVRYNTDGSIDTPFGVGGIVNTTIITGLSCAARDVEVQTNGKILVGGDVIIGGQTNNIDFALARYNSNGSLDNTFDFDGKVTIGFGSASIVGGIASIALQNDGKILAVGSDVFGGSIGIALARFNTNGSLDNTFDFDGKLSTTIAGSTYTGATDLIMQNDGKIVVTGQSESSMLVVRYGENPTYINEFNLDEKFSIFPNPTTDNITINTNKNDAFNASVFNSLGEFMFSEKLTNQAPLNIGHLAKGIYIVEISNGNEIERKKIIVQ